MKRSPTSIAKLILMLSSPHDAEVASAARALDRALKARGEDWHDLVAKLDRPPRQLKATKRKAVYAMAKTMKPAPPPLAAEIVRFRNAAMQIMTAQREVSLSERERQFLGTMIHLRYPPSERQIKWLKDLWGKTFPPRVTV